MKQQTNLLDTKEDIRLSREVKTYTTDFNNLFRWLIIMGMNKILPTDDSETAKRDN